MAHFTEKEKYSKAPVKFCQYNIVHIIYNIDYTCKYNVDELHTNTSLKV